MEVERAAAEEGLNAQGGGSEGSDTHNHTHQDKLITYAAETKVGPGGAAHQQLHVSPGKKENTNTVNHLKVAAKNLQQTASGYRHV